MNINTLDVLDDALMILKVLLSGEDISSEKNSSLYEKYRASSTVEEMLHHVAGKLELRVYSGQDQLFVCPEVGSKLFGWSNEQLRANIPYVSNNTDLHMGYFVIMTLITYFYPEAYPDTPKSYIRIADLVEQVTNRFEGLLRVEDIETASKEYQFDFKGICKAWIQLTDARESVAGGKKDKISFVETICKFLHGEDFINFDSELKRVYPTKRFKTIVWNYYEDRDNRRGLLKFVNSLEGEL